MQVLKNAYTSLPISAEHVRKLHEPRFWCAPQTFYGSGLMVQPYHCVTLAPNGEFLLGARPDYSGGRWLLDDAGEAVGAALFDAAKGS